MWSSVMSNIACCCEHLSYKLHSIACCCANMYNINWTVLHVAVPAGENRKKKTAVRNEMKMR